jgi:DNA mismatch repair ATPase MutS
MGPEFSQTAMGQRFYQKTMPNIAEQLEKINKNLEILTELLHQSLEIDKELRNTPKVKDVW